MGKQKSTSKKTYTVKLTSTAITHLDEIINYIAFYKKEPLNAIKIGNSFFRKIETTGNNPFVFRECESLKTKEKLYREAACHKWSIIYKIQLNQILILAIIHQSRNPSKLKKLIKT